MHTDNIKHNFKILSTGCAREIGQNCSVPNLNALFIGLHLNVGKFKSWEFQLKSQVTHYGNFQAIIYASESR